MPNAEASTAAGGSSPDRPRCSNCGHDLTGAITSSKCPECGRPLVEVLVRDNAMLIKMMGRRYTSKAKLLGIPAISVAFGLGTDGKMGHARGWIAFGDRATGVVACGGLARGVVALGGLSLGVFTAGGMSVGLLGAIGGASIAPLGLAVGGVAVGLVATGGMAIGGIVVGGAGAGWYAWGPPAAISAKHVHQMVAGAVVDPEAADVFDRLRWLFGTNPGTLTLRVMSWLGAFEIFVLLVLALPAVLVWQRREAASEAPPTSSPQ